MKSTFHIQKSQRLAWGLSFLLSGIFYAQASQALPYEISYLGRLTENNGMPIGGPIDLELKFFRSETGNDQIAIPPLQYNALPLADGVFQIKIALTPANFHLVFPDDSSSVFIEVTDLSHGKTYKRQKYSSVPYALKVPADGTSVAYDSSGKLTVVGIKGSALPASNPAPGQVIKWGNAGWEWGSNNVGSGSSTVDSSQIVDGSISNADIAASAAISGTKISPNFGAQSITTTGVISGNGSGLTNLPAGALGTSIESSEITDATITDADISGSAAIAQSKIDGLSAALAAKEAAITAGTSGQYLRGDKNWSTLDTSAVPENTNLYFTDTRARSAVSASMPIAYNNTTGVISMAAATSIANGYLSSSDWLSFNAKQDAISAASTLNTGALTTALQNGIQLKPFGTNASDSGELRFNEILANGTNYVGFKAPSSIAADRIWTLPDVDGTNGQSLVTDGSGTLGWATLSGGGGGSVISVTAGTGLSGGTITSTGTINLSNTAVTAGTYTRGTFTVDAQGRLTAASNGASVDLTTDATGTLPIANGGTGGATAGAARTALGLGSLSTLGAVTTTEITNGTVVDADISGSAAIAQSKISGLSTSLADKEPIITAGSSSQYFRGDKSWAALDTSVVPENTNLYFTDTRARAAISAAAPVAYNSSTGTFSMAAATGVGNGYLSSADWLSFNDKQAAITATSTVNTGRLTSSLQNGVQLKPYGSAAGQTGELHFAEILAAGTNVVGFKAPDSINANTIWTLPVADGAANQFLSTNGSGVLSWASPTGVSSITAGAGLSGGTITGSGTLSLQSTAVTAGSYFLPTITVDAYGRITNASGPNDANPLEIVSNSAGQPTMKLRNTLPTGMSYLTLTNSFPNEFRLGLGGPSSSFPNKFFISDNANPRLVIDGSGSGNIGIGVTNPSTTLDIMSSFSNPALQISNPNSSASAALNLNAGRNYFVGSGGVSESQVSNKFYIKDQTAGIHRLVVDLTGNVGIGTNFPSYLLHVNGSVAGVGAYNTLSDVRYKKDIKSLANSLAKILAIRGVSYKWIDENKYGGEVQLGVIAQEIEQIVPEVVSTGSDGVKRVKYSDLIPLVIEAMQEQNRELEQLKAESAQLKAESAELKHFICTQFPAAELCSK